MSEKPPAVPRPEQPLTPFLGVRNAGAAIEFYERAFGARETGRLVDREGGILHAELEIAGAPLFLAEETPEWDNWSPAHLGGTPVRLHLYVEDVDEVFGRALEAGATELIPVADQFYGDRSGRLEDPFGHVWILASRREDISQEEIRRRADDLFGG